MLFNFYAIQEVLKTNYFNRISYSLQTLIFIKNYYNCFDGQCYVHDDYYDNAECYDDDDGDDDCVMLLSVCRYIWCCDDEKKTKPNWVETDETQNQNFTAFFLMRFFDSTVGTLPTYINLRLDDGYKNPHDLNSCYLCFKI